MSNDLTVYEPRNFGELEAFANRVVRTQLVPQAYRNKPDDAMVAMMFGKETGGLGPLTSLQFIAVINGRPGYYSDAVPGVALNKGLITDIEILEEGAPFQDDYRKVVVITKANGNKTRAEFSVADAKRAGLWDKAGPWKQYPKRMLQWRAIGYGVRDAAPHLLFGNTVEELRDLEEQPHIGPERAKDISPRDHARASAPAAEIVVVDPDGEEFSLLPGELDAKLAEWCRECTDAQLAALAENNPNVGAVTDAVEREEMRRVDAAGQQPDLLADDPDPAKLKGLSVKDAIGTLELRIGQSSAKEADRLLTIYRPKLEQHAPQAFQALQDLVTAKIEGRA